MENSALLPFENVIQQYQCTTNNGKYQGIMIITNVRLLWKPCDKEEFTIQLPIYHPEQIQVLISDAKMAKEKYMVMQIKQKVADQEQKCTFRFHSLHSNKPEEDCKRIKELLQRPPDRDVQQLKLSLLGPDSVEKLRLLQSNNSLSQKFRDNVIDTPMEEVKASSLLEEQDFWSVFTESNTKNESKFQNEHGITNRPLQVTRQQNIKEQKTDYILKPVDCQRLLLEYPELRAQYELQVKVGDDTMAEDSVNFWNEFLEKNHEYQTEPFGGNNPPYIPQLASKRQNYTQNFEDKYKNNQQERLKPQKSEKEKQEQQQQTGLIGLEWNFMNNLNLDDMPTGFGTYDNNKEIDGIYKRNQQLNSSMIQVIAQLPPSSAASVSRNTVATSTDPQPISTPQVIKQTTQTDKDLDKLTGREKEQDIVASQVIQKFNKNSERILETTADSTYSQVKHKPAVKKLEKPKVEDTVMEQSILKNESPFPACWANVRQQFQKAVSSYSTDTQIQTDFSTVNKIQKQLADDANKAHKYSNYDRNLDTMKRDLHISQAHLDEFQQELRKLYIKLKRFYAQIEELERQAKDNNTSNPEEVQILVDIFSNDLLPQVKKIVEKKSEYDKAGFNISKVYNEAVKPIFNKCKAFKKLYEKKKSKN